MKDSVNETIAFQERVAFACLGWNTLAFCHCIGEPCLKAPFYANLLLKTACIVLGLQ